MKEKPPTIETAPPAIEQVSSILCEWVDNRGFKYSAHNYDPETGECVKCGKKLNTEIIK